MNLDGHQHVANTSNGSPGCLNMSGMMTVKQCLKHQADVRLQHFLMLKKLTT